jgi:2-amino-4-hydroxy-6-hydroxymethyldihydropteridine diphosphokinase
MNHCFVALGANLGKPKEALLKALNLIADIEGVYELLASQLYETTPVSSIKQSNYLNAACAFSYNDSLKQLWSALLEIEKNLGRSRIDGIKNAPRLIDLDILFFGNQVHYCDDMIIPHPRWHERLFVLKPLEDLVTKYPLPFGVCLETLLTQFSNPHHEVVNSIGCLYEIC